MIWNFQQSSIKSGQYQRESLAHKKSQQQHYPNTNQK